MSRVIRMILGVILCLLIWITASGCVQDYASTSLSSAFETTAQTNNEPAIVASTATNPVTMTPSPQISPSASATHLLATTNQKPTTTATLIRTATLTSTPGPTPTLAEDAWKSMPVVPESVSDTTRAIYQLGQLMGNNPHTFSKVGDCFSMLPFFMQDFDNAGVYKLGPYKDLQSTIDYFSGSFSRVSMAVKVGLSSGASLAVLWNDWKECSRTETPLDCEYRLNNPSFAILSVGTNDVTDRESLEYFEDKMRRVIDHTIGKGIVPILVTKPDNAEGDHFINATIARLAYEYGIPLWNFWAAIQNLPNHGMQLDKPEHLTIPDDWSLLCNFEDAENMELGFPVRNLTSLQVLDKVRRGVMEWEP